MEPMTAETREQIRAETRNETGTMPPCPFCQRFRVQRSDYVRCCLCGVNWLDGEDLDHDPRIERWDKLLAGMKATASVKARDSHSASPAASR